MTAEDNQRKFLLIRYPIALLVSHPLDCVVLPPRRPRRNRAITRRLHNPARSKILVARVLHHGFQAGVPAGDGRRRPREVPFPVAAACVEPRRAWAGAVLGEPQTARLA